MVPAPFFVGPKPLRQEPSFRTICGMDYLLKTEPTVYSFASLEKEKTTVWDGVTNPVAVKNLRAMKPGDRLVIGRCERSEKSSGEDQGGEGDCEAEDAGGGQSAKVVCGVAAGAAGKIERGAADDGAVSVIGGSVASRGDSVAHLRLRGRDPVRRETRHAASLRIVPGDRSVGFYPMWRRASTM